MKELLYPKVRAHEKYLHELRMTVTETDDFYWEANADRIKEPLTEEQIEALHIRDEGNKHCNHNEFSNPKYWTKQYMERKYSDMELESFNTK